MALDLKTIGLLTRDESDEYPLDEVRGLFARHQISVVLIEDGQTPPNLDLVVAMGAMAPCCARWIAFRAARCWR